MNSVYRVSIYDKSKKLVASYEKIHTIKYIDAALDQCVVSGNEIASHFSLHQPLINCFLTMVITPLTLQSLAHSK